MFSYNLREVLIQKDELIREKLSKSRPIVAASTRDGLVLVTESAGTRKKIWPVSSKIVFGGIGEFTDFKGVGSVRIPGLEGIQDIAVKLVSTHVLQYSEEDVHVDSLALVLGSLIRKIYIDPKRFPICVKFLLAEVNSTPEQDKIFVVSPSGILTQIESSYAVLAGTDETYSSLEQKIKQHLADRRFEELDIETAIDILKKVLTPEGQEIRFEVGIQSRDKKFQRR